MREFFWDAMIENCEHMIGAEASAGSGRATARGHTITQAAASATAVSELAARRIEVAAQNHRAGGGGGEPGEAGRIDRGRRHDGGAAADEHAQAEIAALRALQMLDAAEPGMTTLELDALGERLLIEASGLEARVLQHEIDHLDGVLILERTSRDQRKEAMRALREAQAA